VPLVYVICKDPDRNAPAPTDPKQVLIAQAPLRGASYLADRQKVYRIICNAVSGSDGWTWIRDVKNKDNRAAMIKLRDHYDGAVPRQGGFKMPRTISSLASTRMKHNFPLTST